MVKSKKRLYKRAIVREMDQCTNITQKKYWNLLKKLEQKEYNTMVSPKNLSNHYKNILNAKRVLDIQKRES